LTAEKINETKNAKGRIIAVGTTTVRTLETAAIQAKAAAISSSIGTNPTVLPFIGSTALYIMPGYQFKVVDAMITNFHLPKSTLVMLVSAFSSREIILGTYETAKREGYRFFSFGDAMFIT